jgi:glucokinase
MLLAGDVGGTKTLLGLFTPGGQRPVPHVIKSYETRQFNSFIDMLDAFAAGIGARLDVDAAAIGVAGPVIGEHASLTNVAWSVDAGAIGARLGGGPVHLLNDLEAMAHAVELLHSDEIEVLQAGVPDPDGAAAVIAAGTGLGQAYLRRIDGRLIPFPSEGGHADFAARDDREMHLVQMLRQEYGRAEVEQVLSGTGLVNLHRFTHRGGECSLVDDVTAPDAPAQISRAGMGRRCQGCAEALQLFVSAYGAEAGNLALRALALSGIYLGGGIAPKILPALRGSVFLNAFLDKAPMRELLSRIPVKVILNTDAALLGAAVRAQAFPR